jgi:protein-tyrosine phosphatase
LRVSIGWVDLDGVVNMRDVGGLPTRDGRTVRSGRLLRSDNLQDLTERDVRRLVHDFGVTDIVDLRSNVEYHAEGPGPLSRTALTHHRHSLFRDDEVEVTVEDALVLPWQKEGTRERLRSHDDDYWASHYLGYLADRPDSVSAALHVVATSTGATVVHCAAGKDRTGTVVGLALAVAGVPEEEIVADYVATAERIERIIERLSSRPAYADNLRDRPLEDHTPRPETMARILEVLADRHGGAEGWLQEQGWTEEQVGALRASLIG